MADPSHIRTVRNIASEIAKQKQHDQTCIAKAIEVLKKPPPDTFLGRKTQESFPNEE